ncbi:hypothetical protein THAOC_15721, partial [Thalassiosira oceanica]
GGPRNGAQVLPVPRREPPVVVRASPPRPVRAGDRRRGIRVGPDAPERAPRPEDRAGTPRGPHEEDGGGIEDGGGRREARGDAVGRVQGDAGGAGVGGAWGRDGGAEEEAWEHRQGNGEGPRRDVLCPAEPRRHGVEDAKAAHGPDRLGVPAAPGGRPACEGGRGVRDGVEGGVRAGELRDGCVAPADGSTLCGALGDEGGCDGESRLAAVFLPFQGNLGQSGTPIFINKVPGVDDDLDY